MNNNKQIPPQEPQKDNILESEYHTLFIDMMPEQKISIGFNELEEEVFTIKPPCKRYTVFIDDFMEFERGLHKIFHSLWNAEEHDELVLRINSNGGMVNEGSQFYSIIKNKFAGRTMTILDNKGYSMGALAFCMGDKRVVTERADLMFHDYSSGIGGKGGEIEARNKHAQKFIRKFFKEIIRDTGFLSKKEYENMLIGQDYWMDAEELCRRKIATHVLVNGKEIPAKKYIKKVLKCKK